MVLSLNSYSQDIPATFGDVNLLTPTVFDARAHSLGKCEIMATNGSNAIFSNPAHIVGLKTGRIQFGETAKFGKYENELWDQDANAGKDISDRYESQFEVSQFSFVFPTFNNNSMVSLGIGLNKLFDFSDEFNHEQKSGVPGTDHETTARIDGGIYFLTPTIAFQFSKNLRIGFTYNSSVFGEERYYFKYYEDGNYPNNGQVYEQKMNASYFTLGATYQLHRKLAVGMIYKSEMEIDVEEYYGFYDPYNDNGPERPAYKISMPSLLGFGCEFKLTDIFTLYGEYQTRKFSEITMSDNYSYHAWKSIEIDDGDCIRGGVDATINNKSLRAGFFRDSLPMTDLDALSVLDDKTHLVQTGITYGLGYKVGKFLVELGGEYSVISSESLYTTQTYDNIYDITQTNISFYSSITYFIK
jgi:long-subunit fatty acid transport protein